VSEGVWAIEGHDGQHRFGNACPGLLAYDDGRRRRLSMRAFNDCRFLETEIKLIKDSEASKMGIRLRRRRTSSVLAVATPQRLDGSPAKSLSSESLP